MALDRRALGYSIFSKRRSSCIILIAIQNSQSHLLPLQKAYRQIASRKSPSLLTLLQDQQDHLIITSRPRGHTTMPPNKISLGPPILAKPQQNITPSGEHHTLQ